MKKYILRVAGLGFTFLSVVFGQSSPRQATIVGGGNADRGKCTIEVVVDDVAQVDIHGATATLRTLSGQPARWRRFECTSPLPPNPANFRFSGVDGRGRQDLVRDPRNGGDAVVQIEDKQGGSEGYTFDITWEGRGGSGFPGNQPNYRGNGPDYRGNGPDYRDRPRDYGDRNSDYYRRNGRPFSVDDAVRVCQDEVLRQARRRFRSDNIHFGRTAIDDNPGRHDFVSGTLDVGRDRREERYGFSCSVNFDTGAVRSVDLDSRPLDDDRHYRDERRFR